MKNQWKVDVKGGCRDGEIAIVHVDNEYGFKSYGWGGPDKKIILSTCSTYDCTTTREVFAFAVKLARERCKAMNRGVK